MSKFIKLKAKSTSGDYMAIISVDHIGTVLEQAVGCQIICKNGDMVPVKNSFAEVEKGIQMALGNDDETVEVKEPKVFS